MSAPNEKGRPWQRPAQAISHQNAEIVPAASADHKRFASIAAVEFLGFRFNDGGRAEAGFKGHAGDCVARAIAIASGKPYREVYRALAAGMGSQRKTKRDKGSGASARNGVSTSRKWFKDYMEAQGFTWVPTMAIGQGCKVHLLKGELPAGRLVVAVSKHYTAVIDGVIHDTFNPSRETILVEEGQPDRIMHRCVYGYWRMGVTP